MTSVFYWHYCFCVCVSEKKWVQLLLQLLFTTHSHLISQKRHKGTINKLTFLYVGVYYKLSVYWLNWRDCGCAGWCKILNPKYHHISVDWVEAMDHLWDWHFLFCSSKCEAVATSGTLIENSLVLIFTSSITLADSNIFAHGCRCQVRGRKMEKRCRKFLKGWNKKKDKKECFKIPMFHFSFFCCCWLSWLFCCCWC